MTGGSVSLRGTNTHWPALAGLFGLPRKHQRLPQSLAWYNPETRRSGEFFPGYTTSTRFRLALWSP